MGYVKELLRAPMVSKLYNEYMDRLDASWLSYDDYAAIVRSANIVKLSAPPNDEPDLSGVYSFDCVDESFDPSAVDTEYVIFVSDLSGMDKDAPALIGNVFVQNENVMLVYADEDEYNSDESVRMNPWFKPGWSPDTLLDHMYFGNIVAVRSTALKGVGRCSDIYELVLKTALGRKRYEIYHINDALYHSHYLKRLYAGTDHGELKSRFSDAVSVQGDSGQHAPKVSVIIPSKDNPEILKKCLESLFRLTKDVFFEVIIIDNGSGEENKCKIEGMIDALKQDLVACGYVDKSVDKIPVRYVYKPQPFNFSRMCNQGAKQAAGAYLLFLNDDIEIREGHWLKKMLIVAARKHTGAVGAKLYYPDSMMIQHAGITNLRLGPVHKLQFKDDRTYCYMDLNEGVRNCIAVTGACLLISRSKYDEVGGFCEELEVAFNDVDLCFRLYENGYHNAVCNNTHLWHHESLSRGGDDSEEKLARLTAERELLYDRHRELYATDPYLSLHMCNDILDNNYSFIYEYDYRDVTGRVVPRPWNGRIKDIWENECLMTSLEYAGSFDRFGDINAPYGTDVLISGYAYVAGSDNSCFARDIILKGKNNSYIINAPDVYRPDLEMNLDPEEYALMCGFSVVFDKSVLPADEYRVCILTYSRCSRLKLFRQTSRIIDTREQV